MNNQNQAQPASDAAKRVIELWNASINSFFLTMEAEDGPNPPEIVVNVRSGEESYLGVAQRQLSYLARIMETATVEHVPLAKNAEGKLQPTDAGQKALDESGESTDLTFTLLMTLCMVFVDTKALEGVSEEELLAALVPLNEETDESSGEVSTGSLEIREKVIGNKDGAEVKHITFNVLAESEDECKDLRALQKEFVSLYKSGKITCALKPYTEEEAKAFQ